ncbi:MAG: hypothetical protein ABII18_09855 [bacterium]
MLKTIEQLITTLNSKDIAYCHWKSNYVLEQALDGYDDLDLLVRKKHALKFETTIFDLGFKRVLPMGSSAHPAVEHFFGYDEASGKLVHLHIYYQILTGEGLLKNYHLPFEDIILNNTIREQGIPIPSRRLELEMAVMRSLLKFGSLYEQFLFSKEKKNIQKEIQFLLTCQETTEVSSILLQEFSGFSIVFFNRCVRCLEKGSLIKWFFLGKKMRRLLKNCRRYSFFTEHYLKGYEFIKRVVARIGPRKRKVFAHGGLVIAITGSDATGKSTVSSHINEWLKKAFTVRLIHAGKPPAGLLNFIPTLLLPFIRRFFNRARTSVSCKLRDENVTGSLLKAVRLLLLARDRKRLVTRAFQRAIDGTITISDRYPSHTHGAMDSPRIGSSPKWLKGFILEKMASREKSIYESIPKADLLIQLTIDVEVAVQRNRDRIKAGNETEDYIRIRHKENSNLEYPYHHRCVVSTNGELDSILAEVRTIAWQHL